MSYKGTTSLEQEDMSGHITFVLIYALNIFYCLPLYVSLLVAPCIYHDYPDYCSEIEFRIKVRRQSVRVITNERSITVYLDHISENLYTPEVKGTSKNF